MIVTFEDKSLFDGVFEFSATQKVRLRFALDSQYNDKFFWRVYKMDSVLDVFLFCGSISTNEEFPSCENLYKQYLQMSEGES